MQAKLLTIRKRVDVPVAQLGLKTLERASKHERRRFYRAANARREVDLGGTPPQGFLFVAQDIFNIPFGMFFLGFSIFWTITAADAKAGPPNYFPLLGIPFILIVVYMLVGRFFTEVWLRRRTAYAVTDKRILIARGPPFRKFAALSIAQLPEVGLTERADGRGTIYFGPQRPWWQGEDRGAVYPTHMFQAIPEAGRVFGMIQRQKARFSCSHV